MPVSLNLFVRIASKRVKYSSECLSNILQIRKFTVKLSDKQKGYSFYDKGKIASEKFFQSSMNLVKQLEQERSKVATSILEFDSNIQQRVRVLSVAKIVPEKCNGIVYWMSRDMRVQDNWAFLYAQKLALKYQLPLHVCFCLVPKFLGMISFLPFKNFKS